MSPQFFEETIQNFAEAKSEDHILLIIVPYDLSELFFSFFYEFMKNPLFREIFTESYAIGSDYCFYLDKADNEIKFLSAPGANNPEKFFKKLFYLFSDDKLGIEYLT
jgi:hypothetical protein